jgi:hypothetical protein
VRGTLFHLEGRREPLEAIEARIEASARAVLARADDEDLPPARVALREVEERLAGRRRGETSAAGARGPSVRQ